MCTHTHAHDVYIQGGVYDGEWKQGLKDGFGCYKVFSKNKILSLEYSQCRECAFEYPVALLLVVCHLQRVLLSDFYYYLFLLVVSHLQRVLSIVNALGTDF